MKATLLLVCPSSSLLYEAQICVFMLQDSFSGMHMENMTAPDTKEVCKGKGVARAAEMLLSLPSSLPPSFFRPILLTSYFSPNVSLHTTQVQRRTCSAFRRKDNVNKGVLLLLSEELKVRDT